MTAILCAYRDCPTIAPRNGYCHKHKKADNRRRHAKRRDHGRNTAAWRRLRAGRLELDRYQCQRCGSAQDLTVHVDPALHGNDAAATIDNLITLCKSHHRTEDAPVHHFLQHRQHLDVDFFLGSVLGKTEGLCQFLEVHSLCPLKRGYRYLQGPTGPELMEIRGRPGFAVGHLHLLSP